VPANNKADATGLARSPLLFLAPAAFALASGCKQQAPMVYVLESPPSVTLTASASASKVQQGETVVLRAQRHTTAKWRQIPRDQLRPGQCWVYRPPAASEPEVADTLEWKVVPVGSVRFSPEVRMDHAEVVTMVFKGSIKLTPLSAVTCEPGRVVEGPAIEIEVS
jgi:hypothetical protein